MKHQFIASALLLFCGISLSAQHTVFQKEATLQVTGKAVAKVNGTELSDRDLLREMYAIFPYARQHNGAFPQAMEADIRKGALKMIEFEELVYQEALRRKMTVLPARLNKAEQDFRKQFHTPEQYQTFLKAECQGQEKVLRARIRRSLL
ncbi:MAG TPA: SurA N-terminal domain-containing protein, partial [Candidatus Limnocylindrales bacterium]|nr:SurA N-terminal domain-containing protein [Candidatus Limnocylindrales bacterium]